MSCAKFFTCSPAVSVTSRPCGPFSVTARVAASIAVIVAVILTVSATPTLPGSFATTAAPVWAAAGTASAAMTAKPMVPINLRIAVTPDSGWDETGGFAAMKGARYERPVGAKTS